MADNRRSSTRHDVQLTGTLSINGESRDIMVMNLSLGGASIGIGGRMPIGQRVQIAFRIPTAEDAIDIGATVRWSDDKATGIQFDGLRARDVWALNKFFEQLTSASS